jgi:predicted O-methyltransferase YrrM
VSGFRVAEDAIASRQCLQRKWELLALAGLVRKLRPMVVVEIGTYKGGTLRCWAHVCPANTTFVSVDLPGGMFGGGCSDEEASQFRSLLRGEQTLHTVRSDSHAADTLNRVATILDGRSVDFLFIDGDHTYAGVKADYDLYSQFVRPGGLIAFHDIVPHQHNDQCRVHEFWAELRDRPDALELVDRDGYDVWGGIGVVQA